MQRMHTKSGLRQPADSRAGGVVRPQGLHLRGRFLEQQALDTTAPSLINATARQARRLWSAGGLRLVTGGWLSTVKAHAHTGGDHFDGP